MREAHRLPESGRFVEADSRGVKYRKPRNDGRFRRARPSEYSVHASSVRTSRHMGMRGADAKKPEAHVGTLDVPAGRDYCVTMRNITVSVDDETYRQARIKAAERETSVSALVREFLTDLATEGGESERLLQQERALRARVTNFSASDRLSRNEVHDRRR